MRQYNQALNGQMEESKLKKRYGNSLMTEHERRVHEKDIQAFVEGDNQNLYSRAIPGLSSGHESNLQDKYIEKLFSGPSAYYGQVPAQANTGAQYFNNN